MDILEVCSNIIIRASAPVDAKFLSILQKKKKHVFFYFTHPLLQNTHISLSILYIYSIKYSFLNHLTQYLSLSHRPNTIQNNQHLATINDQSTRHTHHHQPTHQNPKTTNQNHQNSLIKIIKTINKKN